MKMPCDMHKVLEEQSDSIILYTIVWLCSCCYSKKGATWSFTRAPEPNDINWQNMGVSGTAKCCRRSLSYFVSLLTVGITFGIVATIKMEQDAYIKEHENDDLENKSLQE
jgi:hypothetical protein